MLPGSVVINFSCEKKKKEKKERKTKAKTKNKEKTKNKGEKKKKKGKAMYGRCGGTSSLLCARSGVLAVLCTMRSLGCVDRVVCRGAHVLAVSCATRLGVLAVSHAAPCCGCQGQL